MKEQRISRRSVLLGFLLGLVGLCAAYLTFWRRHVEQNTAAPSLEDLLARGLARYNIRATGMRSFVQELQQVPRSARSQLLPWFGYGAPLEDSLVRGFLLSCDLSEDAGVRHATFRKLYHPYHTICANPYARFSS